MNELLLKIINMSISASWLVLAVLICRFVLKKAPKWINVLLWGIVAVRLICPFSFESALSLIPSAETFPDQVISGPSFDVQTGIAPVDNRINDYLGDRYFEGVTVPTNNGNNVMTILTIVWIIGILLLVTYTIISYQRLNRKIDTAVRYKDNIFQSENVSSPFVLGIIKPRIYLPFNTNDPDLEYVVAHEQVHIRRRDHWWKPLGFLLLTVYWFNPLLWLAYALLCRDIELACDESVIREMDCGHRADYTKALVACSVSRRTLAACPLAFGEVSVKQRVKSVLHYTKPTIWLVIAAALVCAVTAVCFLTDPVTVRDHLVLTDSNSPADTNRLSYDIRLGTQAMSGKLYAEQWVGGTCVRSAPVIMTKYVDTIEITMREHREGGASLGTYVQIETNQYGGSLLTYFAHPEQMNITGWGFTGHELNEKVELAPRNETLLAAKVFDTGSGVRVFDCETLAAEPERLENAACMIVVRAIFSEDPLGAVGHSETTPPKEVLNLNDVIILSQKGYDLTWADFEKYDYSETGSGLYIRLYEINDQFHFSIGGAGPDSEPMYMYLGAAGDDPSARIDIRDGGVTEFISEYKTDSAPIWDRIPMVMVDDTLYLDTGFESDFNGSTGDFDGTVTSQVDSSQAPAVNDQSNFGTGYGWRYGSHAGTVELYINGKWWVFATEEARQELQFGSQPIIHYPAHKTLYEETPAEMKAAAIENEEFIITALHYEAPDGTWRCGDHSYRYRLEITGRMPNAAKNTAYIVLSNTEDITFTQAWKASGFSSNTADYFAPEDAVIVGHRLFD